MSLLLKSRVFTSVIRCSVPSKVLTPIKITWPKAHISSLSSPPPLLPIERRPFVQHRSLSYQQREPPFFNRHKEIESILKLVEEKPGLYVFTGPPNSGKSRLLNEVLKSKEEEGCPILHIDMRLHSFRDVPSFLSSMEKTMVPWYKGIANAAKSLKVLKLGPAELHLSDVYDDKDPDVESLFQFIYKNAPTYSVWNGKKYPIVFIDETNKMENLVETDTGRKALMSLMEFFVKCTKQDGRFPVLLASSDSFFHLWLDKLIGNGRFNTYVIGHLSKKEAKRYWEEHAISLFRRLCERRPATQQMEPPEFEDVYTVCGGSIYYMDWYCFDCIDHMLRFRGSPLPPEKFSFVRQAKMHLYRGLMKLADEWSKDEMLSVMQEINENGFIDYQDLCDRMGADGVVNAMIKENMIHLRPSSFFAYDLDFEHENAIVTAESPPSAVAMRKIVQYYK